MESKEHFERVLKAEQEFSKYQLEDLIMLGVFLGGNSGFFKKIYKAYHTKETDIEMTPSRGAPVVASFLWESREVIITKLKVEITLSVDLFLKFLGAIDLCFGEMFPVGSVVEIDLDYFPELKNTMSQTRAIIVGQKVTLSEEMDFLYIDYVANLWPHGNQGHTPPLFLSNVMTTAVIHLGLINEEEREHVQKMKEVIINTRQKSITFISEKELEKLDKMVIGGEGRV